MNYYNVLHENAFEDGLETLGALRLQRKHISAQTADSAASLSGTLSTSNLALGRFL